MMDTQPGPEETTAVAVFGARGRMGQLVCAAIEDSDDLSLVARIGHTDNRAPAQAAAVVVDFTSPEAVMDNIRWALDRGKHVVVGTSGLDDGQLSQINDWLSQPAVHSAVLVIPNFSQAAMLSKRFAEMAAPFFDDAEVLDLAHERKIDAPSGTSLDTARAIVAARHNAGLAPSVDATTLEGVGARGYPVDDVRIHSIRMKGLISHQEVLFSRKEELLSVRFDTLDRAAFMPGVLRAVRLAPERSGLHVGLASLYDML